jgi:hypothetical protein
VDLEKLPYSDPIPSPPIINQFSKNSSSLAIIPYMAPPSPPQENNNDSDMEAEESPPVVQAPPTDHS